MNQTEKDLSAAVAKNMAITFATKIAIVLVLRRIAKKLIQP